MRLFPKNRGRSVVLAGALLCFAAAIAFGESEPAADGSSPQSGNTSSPDSGNGSSQDVGLGLFSKFPVRVSASVRGGYDDNVNTTPSGASQGSGFTSADLVFSYDFGSPRTKFNLSTTTGFIYYFDSIDNQYEPNLNLTISLVHKASPRLTFNVQAYAAYQTEPDFTYGLGTNRRAGNYFSTADQFSVAYLWAPRFSTNTRYSINAVHYDDTGVGFFEDRIDNTIGNEFRFLVLPTTNLIAEYRLEHVSYANEGAVIVPAMNAPGMHTPAVLLQRDSTTHYLLGGIDHVFSSRISTDVRGGVEFRQYEDQPEKTSPYFEAAVNYVVGKNTSVAWSNHYEIEEGDVAFNPSRTTFRSTLSARHNITARVSATLSLYYTHDEYDSFTSGSTTSPGFSEDSFNTDLMLQYLITRYLGVTAGYDFTDVTSDQSIRDYTRNRVWVGASVSF